MTARQLRPHQISGLNRLREALRSTSSAVMLQAPTGAGKTRLAAEIVLGALSRGKTVLITVPSLSLVDQTVEALDAEGIAHIGVIQARHPRTDPSAPVQVASVRTLQRRGVPPADITIIDEAHEFFGIFAAMIAEAKAARRPIIGLSATPWTVGLGRHYGALVNVTTTSELIGRKFLSPFRAYALATADLAGVRILGGDYHPTQLAKAMSRPDLIEEVVKSWIDRADRRPTLVFGVSREHARTLQEAFLRAGVLADYVDAFTSRDERAEIRARFHDGRAEVVCSVGALTRGVDWDVRAIVLARPTKSEMLYVQMIGRGLRTAAGKTDCLILDHSGTSQRLGLVTDIKHDALDTDEASPPARNPMPKPVRCSECFLLRPREVHACPGCGHAPIRLAASTVKPQRPHRPAAATSAGPIDDHDRRRSVYGQLRQIGRDRGYSPGWAYHRFDEMFGDKPSDVMNAPLLPPSKEILELIRIHLANYAIEMRRREQAPSR